MTSPLRALEAAGQAIWLDYLHRRILEDGELARLIASDGLTGLTSNPSIFEQAIAQGDTYDRPLATLLAKDDADVAELYESLAVADLRQAADQFRPVFEARSGADGFVSLEVSPYLAMDTEGTIAEARRLWRRVDRPNLMVKVPGTGPGVGAIRALIGEGVNVNVTLLFGIDAYLAVAEAHLAGLEDLRAAGGDVSRVHGVASFFVSRIDGVIDKAIDARLADRDGEVAALRALRGKVAIANAKVAYQHYLALIATERWRALADAGARPQRLLWASTGTKDPAYSDVLYVDSLIGPDTVNTVPPKTLEAFRDHGRVAPTLTSDVNGARHILAEADRLGLDLAGVTRDLVVDGAEKFSTAFDGLLAAVADKRARHLGPALNRQAVTIPPVMNADFRAILETAAKQRWTGRLWAKDGSLWPGGAATNWLGWLDALGDPGPDLAAYQAFGEEVRAGAIRQTVLLGMGGSSLGPEVLSQVFGPARGCPPLIVIDTTDPSEVARLSATIDPRHTLFIVSSKSGSTLEAEVLRRHFFALTETAVGRDRAGAHFVAITDPGSPLETTARLDGWRRVFEGDPAIGGRYSVLSAFGLVPAAVLGLDLRRALASARTMAFACGPGAPPAANPAFQLGALLGGAARAGRNKMTLFASPATAAFGEWLEQLLAESTGKAGAGIIPVVGETLRPAEAYGADRLFVQMRLDGDDDPALDSLIRELEEAGQPVVRIALADRDRLWQEFVRWEIATAVAGAALGIDPFDQPDVEASKVRARDLTAAAEAGPAPSTATPQFESQGLGLIAPAKDTAYLDACAGVRTLEAWLRAHLSRAGDHDYIALLAWLDRTPTHMAALAAIRARIGRWSRAATTLGFGPRYLHSTGQAHKGGPDEGVFLQIRAHPKDDVPIPGRAAGFATVEAAQARGDFEVLAERGRRLLGVDLGVDTTAGLTTLLAALDRALV